MRQQLLFFPAMALCFHAFAAVPAGEKIDVSLKIHNEVNPWTLSSDAMLAPAWEKDGTLSIWYQAHGNGSFRVVETGAQASVSNTELSLCYNRAPVKYEVNQPVPAISYPVTVDQWGQTRLIFDWKHDTVPSPWKIGVKNGALT